MSSTSQRNDSEQSQTTDGDEGSDKPPHDSNIDLSSSVSSVATIMPQTNGTSIPLPPPEAGTYEKQPGHTVGTLKKLVLATGPPAPTHTKQPSMTSSNGTQPTSSLSSPATTSSSDDPHSDWGSEPPTRPPTQPPSRAPSMSAGHSGGKLLIPKTVISQSSPGTPISQTPNPIQKSTSTPSTPHPPAHIPQVAAGNRSKAASVHSNDGRDDKDKHKFTLKDLLSSGPKLSRKSSQRSTGSSRRSDTDRDSIHDGYTGRSSGPKSAAGDSTASLSKKYGVCQKLAIGKGATSVVRLAHKWDRTEEKLYAVKEFRKRRKNESEKEYVKKLTSEFCISSTLHHINIVETVDLVQDENQKWCEVMEFCPGGDLYAAIKKGGMSPSEVECCFKQILNGVRYLHAQGVAHRDIKPENLFFDTKGHLKIGDYGASTVYRLPWEATIHMSTGLCGSEPYIAPEQFLGKPYDARLVDIWACGIVYYCLHFQELPWRAAQQSDTLFQAYATACASPSPAVSTCPPTINNLSPRACRSLIRKMLEPDPKARSSIEEVMKHSWIDTIEVCHEVDDPKHVHVHARALAKQQLNQMREPS